MKNIEIKCLFKNDDKNEIYYEYIEPKYKGYTFVFVNALTGNTDRLEWRNR